jgi:hypothetical protein
VNEIEVGRLLTAAKVLDPKMPEPDEHDFVLRLWTNALHDVPFEPAEQALTEYYRSSAYRESRDPISPADIVGWWRDRRRYAAVDRDRPPVKPEQITAGVDRVMTELARRKAIASGEDPDTALEIAEGNAGARRMVRSVRCTHCGAQPGQPCTGPRGVPLTKTEAHDSRVRAAMGRQDEPSTPRSAEQARREIDGMDPAG